MLILSFLKEFRVLNHKTVGLELAFIWLLLWGRVCLMERNRAPFDLLEGESELIRGFNVELSSLIFVLLFLREYGVIVRLSLISTLLVAGSLLAGILLATVLLFIRCCFPRIRYDVMMTIMWKELLPCVAIIYSLGLLVFK
jgi:NADH:ubiquinone oxidoreductase subunit H